MQWDALAPSLSLYRRLKFTASCWRAGGRDAQTGCARPSTWPLQVSREQTSLRSFVRPSVRSRVRFRVCVSVFVCLLSRRSLNFPRRNQTHLERAPLGRKLFLALPISLAALQASNGRPATGCCRLRTFCIGDGGGKLALSLTHWLFLASTNWAGSASLCLLGIFSSDCFGAATLDWRCIV